MIRVVVSEGHRLLRQGVVSALERDDGVVVLAVAETVPAALAVDAQHAPDVHLVGASLPPTTGYEAARQLARRRPGAGIVVVAPARPADHEQAGSAYHALVAGARGYLTGEADAAELLRAVRAVAAGDAYLAGPSLLAVVEEVRRLATRQAALTLEHRTTLALVRRGLTNKEISAASGVSLSTVKRRIHELEATFGVHGRTQIAIHGLLPDDVSPSFADGTDAVSV